MIESERLVEIRFPSRADRLKLVRGAVRCAAEMRGCSHEETDRLVLAVNEACMNIIQHAYGTPHVGEIILEILNNRDELVFRLSDFAEPVDKNTIRPRDLNDVRPGGLGVHFINQVMDRAEFLEAPAGVGNVLELVKRVGGQNNNEG